MCAYHFFSCSEAKFSPIGAVLLSGMVKLIGETKEDPRLRGLAYVAVGKIARRVPKLVTKDIALLQTFFDAICKVGPMFRYCQVFLHRFINTLETKMQEVDVFIRHSAIQNGYIQSSWIYECQSNSVISQHNPGDNPLSHCKHLLLVMNIKPVIM